MADTGAIQIAIIIIRCYLSVRVIYVSRLLSKLDLTVTKMGVAGKPTFRRIFYRKFCFRRLFYDGNHLI